MDHRTKIVATLGPASANKTILLQLLAAGVNVVRLNFSHGTHPEHAGLIALLREVSDPLNQPITLLQDLQGPKIRVGEIKYKSITLKEGKPFTLTTQPTPGDEQMVSVDFPDLPKYVKPGSRILLDDGSLELAVVAVSENQIQTKVVLGGALKPNKGINLPGSRIDFPILTEKDKADLAFGLEHGIDAVAMSFVCSAEDVRLIRNVIARFAPDRKDTPIIAKLERPEALANLDEIIVAADGVMVARGDLGVELPPEEVPIIQKRIIAAANRRAKLVITATQMLDSMITKPRPTRAETSDVANAIFDGTDAVMLSGETAIGKYPVESVKMMAAIIRQAEANLTKWGHWDGNLGEDATGQVTLGEVTHDDALSITRAARELAHDRNVTAIAVFTQTGRTAHLIAKARPLVPILAFTPTRTTYQRLPMLWGVLPFLVPFVDTLEAMLESVENAILSTTSIQPGQQVVLISGFPVGALCPPNLALLHTIRQK
jgi:pyruvate kinase